MGSIIAFEIAKKAIKYGCALPEYLFISGQVEPKAVKMDEKVSGLPDELFLEHIVKLGGTPNEVLECKELMDIYLPILKSDFKILEDYEHVGDNIKLDCSIVVLSGEEDDQEEKDILSWEKYTKGSCEFYTFSGGHFFINEKPKEIVSIINKYLSTI